MNGPAPLLGLDPGFEDEEFDEPECDGSCEDDFCGVNCPMEFGHAGPHLCDYHEWVAAACPEPGRQKTDV